MSDQPPNPHADASAPSEFARDGAPVEPISVDLTPVLKHLLANRTLSVEQTTRAFEAMMTGEVHHGEIGAMLALLAMRTPTSDEILGAARVMRAHVDRLESSLEPDRIVDTAGTGGAPKTFNVSTAAAIVAAGARVPVAKHGNRSRTGRGSAEVLRQLGVHVDAGREQQRQCLEEAHVCFCFAVHHHPATRHVMPVRLALGFPTIFNLLGPLTNPAGARRQIMGVYDRRFVRPIAEALAELGALRAMVIHSDDGLDEISISAPTRIAHVETNATGTPTVREAMIDPTELGLKLAPREDVVARNLEHAAEMIRAILSGADRGPARDMTLLNAAATIFVGGHADSMADGLTKAAAAVDDGRAGDALEQLARLSHG